MLRFSRFVSCLESNKASVATGTDVENRKPGFVIDDSGLLIENLAIDIDG
jgi:hypothetical protein